MLAKGLRDQLISPKHPFLATFLLQERSKPIKKQQNSPFLEILPKSLSNFPIFFNEIEAFYLSGSPFLEAIEEKKREIKQDYDLICQEVPDFAQFTLREFSEMRMLTSSRGLGIQVEGKDIEVFIPLADMVNHQGQG